MDAIDENIRLPEIPVLKKKFSCEKCGKQYKSKKGYETHVKKCLEEFEEEYDIDNMTEVTEFAIEEMPNINELHRLRKEFENIILNNPSIDLDKKVNTSILEKITQMSVEELKARIFNAKRELNSHLDMKISDGALSIMNQVVGRLLNCVDELDEEVMKDQLLRQSTKDMLSMNVLSMIPSNIKVAGLYSVNVATALTKSRGKISHQTIENNVQP
jgi:hypothetical protein